MDINNHIPSGHGSTRIMMCFCQGCNEDYKFHCNVSVTQRPFSLISSYQTKRFHIRRYFTRTPQQRRIHDARSEEPCAPKLDGSYSEGTVVCRSAEVHHGEEPNRTVIAVCRGEQKLKLPYNDVPTIVEVNNTWGVLARLGPLDRDYGKLGSVRN